MAKPERPYQWSFDFGRKEQPSIYYELGFAGHENRDDTGRFVRKLKEEVQIRSPNDAAAHLLNHVFTPFEAFDQEELWTILLNTLVSGKSGSSSLFSASVAVDALG